MIALKRLPRSCRCAFYVTGASSGKASCHIRRMHVAELVALLITDGHVGGATALDTELLGVSVLSDAVATPLHPDVF